MNAPAAGEPGQRLLFELVHAIVSAFAVTAAAELGLADALTGHPRTSEELARTLAVHEASLRRLLRMLAAAGIVHEAEPGRFALTPAGVALKSGSAGSVQPALGMLQRFMLPALQQTADSVRTGGAGFTRIFGAPLYDYLEQHGDAAEHFGQALRSFQALFPSVLDAYDFTEVHTLVDVGGGEGWRLVEILRAHATVQGILFDRPSMAEHAQTVLADAGLAQRARVVGGSFFDEVPAGGDCYLLALVLPNWDDPQALSILRTCRRAMPEEGRLLIFEPLLPEDSEVAIAAALDLLMLVVFGGRLRTQAELGGLLDSAGFRLHRVAPAPPLALVEAIAR